MNPLPQSSSRPFSQSCENNKAPILAVLREELADVNSVLEIGSGTGQHARYFAEQLPSLTWQPSDLPENLPGIEAWRADYNGDNLPPPVALDCRAERWPLPLPEAVFTANSLHIMAWPAVESLFRYLANHGPAPSRLLIYGPFNYRGTYTSDSNARFDQWLAAQNPESAIRHFESVDKLAQNAGYTLKADHPMPANNRLVVWHKPANVL